MLPRRLGSILWFLLLGRSVSTFLPCGHCRLVLSVLLPVLTAGLLLFLRPLIPGVALWPSSAFATAFATLAWVIAQVTIA